MYVLFYTQYKSALYIKPTNDFMIHQDIALQSHSIVYTTCVIHHFHAFDDTLHACTASHAKGIWTASVTFVCSRIPYTLVMNTSIQEIAEEIYGGNPCS